MDSDGALFALGHYLRFLLQTTDDAVYSVEEVLLANLLAVVASSYQGCLIADVGDVGS